MKVKQLKQILSECADSDEVVIGSGDESGYSAEIDEKTWGRVVDGQTGKKEIVLYLVRET